MISSLRPFFKVCRMISKFSTLLSKFANFDFCVFQISFFFQIEAALNWNLQDFDFAFLHFSVFASVFFQWFSAPQNAICDDLNFQSNARNPQKKKFAFFIFFSFYISPAWNAQNKLFAFWVLNLFSNAKIAQISFWKEVFHFS